MSLSVCLFLPVQMKTLQAVHLICDTLLIVVGVLVLRYPQDSAFPVYYDPTGRYFNTPPVSTFRITYLPMAYLILNFLRWIWLGGAPTEDVHREYNRTRAYMGYLTVPILYVAAELLVGQAVITRIVPVAMMGALHAHLLHRTEIANQKIDGTTSQGRLRASSTEMTAHSTDEDGEDQINLSKDQEDIILTDVDITRDPADAIPAPPSSEEVTVTVPTVTAAAADDEAPTAKITRDSDTVFTQLAIVLSVFLFILLLMSFSIVNDGTTVSLMHKVAAITVHVLRGLEIVFVGSRPPLRVNRRNMIDKARSTLEVLTGSVFLGAAMFG